MPDVEWVRVYRTDLAPGMWLLTGERIARVHQYGRVTCVETDAHPETGYRRRIEYRMPTEGRLSWVGVEILTA